ncbi:MAG TPA: hypothetical protein VEP90_12080 [Methylomirabilota bacterium]|nr:hypothetical protein [Methylomirabilota bacterium]
MARKIKHVPLEDKQLQEIVYCVGEGFRKIVPAGNMGWPGFTSIGSMNRDEDKDNYLLVELSVFENTFDNKWTCIITIKDGDDFIYQRFLDFTMENWIKQINTYKSINEIDAFAMKYLELEGFG